MVLTCASGWEKTQQLWSLTAQVEATYTSLGPAHAHIGHGLLHLHLRSGSVPKMEGIYTTRGASGSVPTIEGIYSTSGASGSVPKMEGIYSTSGACGSVPKREEYTQLGGHLGVCLKWREYTHTFPFWGCTFCGIYAPCIYSHAR